MSSLLQVRHLNVTIWRREQHVAVLHDISFKLHAGQSLGLIGESGSGKSMTALALMGLLPEFSQASGSIRLQDQELMQLDERQWQKLRGAKIAMIFQEPMSALNPVHPVGKQIAEPLRIHQKSDRKTALARALALMQDVRIAQAHKRLGDYPHEFSGGERQRILIAMALACKPDILIADEPTTGLDAHTRQQVLHLLKELGQARQMALLLISHDLATIARNVDETLVMYGGKILERGPSAQVFEHPAHPYTRGLLAARPRLQQRMQAQRSKRLSTIAGQVPDMAQMPAGCPFAGRCPYTRKDCWTQQPPRIQVGPAHSFDCLHADLVLPKHGPHRQTGTTK